MNPETIKALSSLSTGCICALGLLGALYVIHSQNQHMRQLMERQTEALEQIATTYAGG